MTEEFVLGQKLEMWRTIGNVTMLWWVSAIVLCLSILGAAWTHGHKLKERFHLHVAGVAIMVFFTMVFSYGLLVILYIPRLHEDLVALLAAGARETTTFDSELWFFRFAMYTGTADYLMVMAVWVIMWIHYARTIGQSPSQPQPPA